MRSERMGIYVRIGVTRRLHGQPKRDPLILQVAAALVLSPEHLLSGHAGCLLSAWRRVNGIPR